MEITGTIIQQLPRTEGVSSRGNAWKKDEYVLETDGTYPKKVKFTIFGDRADQIRLTPGKRYTLAFDLESREFNGRWYTDVNVYSAQDEIAGAGSQSYGQPAPPVSGSMGAAPATAPSADPFATPAGGFQAPAGDKIDDLPF